MESVEEAPVSVTGTANCIGVLQEHEETGEVLFFPLFKEGTNEDLNAM